jgi:hypothetical protein
MGLVTKSEDVVKQYLDLLKRVLLNNIYESAEYSIRLPSTDLEKRLFSQLLKSGERLVRLREIPEKDRENGQIWPPSLIAHTMIGKKRLDNLQFCIETVLKEEITGDFIETGVWRGGATIFMKGCLHVYGDMIRDIWVADSFCGLPKPDKAHIHDKGDVHYTIPELAVTLEEVQQNFSRYGLLDNRVKFLKGWFNETLFSAPIQNLSLIRLDGDMYGSTIVALEALYPKLSSGGFLIIDDFCLKPCAQAVHDYRKLNSITETIIDIDGTGAYWQKATY